MSRQTTKNYTETAKNLMKEIENIYGLPQGFTIKQAKNANEFFLKRTNKKCLDRLNEKNPCSA